MDEWFNEILAGTAVALVWIAWRWMQGRGERQPVELKDAVRIWTERQFTIDEPVRLVARIDAAWRLSSGEIVLVEVKRRRGNRVHRSDVLQLSAQRWVVMAATGRAVADWSLVRVVSGGWRPRIRWHRVRLMDEAVVAEVVWRRERLLVGTVEADVVGGARVCRGCGWRHSCPERRR